MFEESVCLLLRAAWFQPLKVENHVEHEDAYDPIEDFYQYQYDYEYDDEDDETSRIQEAQVHHLASQKRKRQLKKSQQVDGQRGH
ncbi:hypothetical protein HN51_023932 [Arachis hypogaea]